MEVTSGKAGIDALFDKLAGLIQVCKDVEISRTANSELIVDTNGNHATCLPAEHIVMEVSTACPHFTLNVVTTGPVPDHLWVHGGDNTINLSLTVENGRLAPN